MIDVCFKSEIDSLFLFPVIFSKTLKIIYHWTIKFRSAVNLKVEDINLYEYIIPIFDLHFFNFYNMITDY